MSEIDGSSNNTVSGNNVIANNGEGLFLLVNSTGNMIFHNNLYARASAIAFVYQTPKHVKLFVDASWAVSLLLFVNL